MQWSTKWAEGARVERKLTDDIILTFECIDCGQELDVNTKSFAELCEAAKKRNWKLIWKDEGYDIYCAGCQEE